MELALLVYAVSLLETLNPLALILSIFGGVLLLVYILTKHLDDLNPPYFKTVVGVTLVSMALLVFLPSTKTAYLMIGAYAGQKVVESPEVQELSGDILKIIKSKVKEYAEEMPKK
jgi:hypothetical protein